MIKGYVGIDVAIAGTKRLPICICTYDGQSLVPLPLRDLGRLRPPRGPGNAAIVEGHPKVAKQYAAEALEYLRAVEVCKGLQICRVAIDAPSAPRCERLNLRRAEQGLQQRGLRFFKTPDRSEFQEMVAAGRSYLGNGGAPAGLPNANRIWMLAGFALFEVLGEAFECIEVYPHATVAALGAGAIAKGTPAGLNAQLAAVAQRTGWPHPPDANRLKDVGFGSLDDKLDAYSSAWVASLPEPQREALGSPPGDAIWVPRVE